MKKKAAIGLSINTLVILIISFVVLAGGIAFLTNLISDADEAKRNLDTRTKSEINRLLIDKGQQLAIPFNKQIIKRGESYLFGLGILNVEKENTEFYIEVDPPIYDGELTSEQIETFEDNVVYNSEMLTVDINSNYNAGILIQLDESIPIGKYIFNVKVYKGDGNQYHNTQKIYVEAI